MPLSESSGLPSPASDTRKSRRLRSWLTNALVSSPVAAQGVHIDPLTEDAPSPMLWPKAQRSAWFSEDMERFRACLLYDGMDVRDSVLDDLSRYYGTSPEESLRRCLHWEQWSVDEWRTASRATREGLRDFYNSVQSWSFDLMWYAYLQAAGFGCPASVLAVRFARQKCPGGHHLDFGSGVGVTSQLFARQGFDTTCADVSKTLLDFARWRIGRHGGRAGAHDLTSGPLETAHYDVVTAIDSLVYVPDFDATAQELHRVIRPGGWLLTNFDVRKKGADESAWHLYDDALDLEFRLRRAGFVQRTSLDGALLCYQRVEPASLTQHLRRIRDRITLKPPLGTIMAFSRRIKWPTPTRIRRFLRHALRYLRNSPAES
jgi:SAM-dependent methyltransferase